MTHHPNKQISTGQHNITSLGNRHIKIAEKLT